MLSCCVLSSASSCAATGRMFSLLQLRKVSRKTRTPAENNLPGPSMGGRSFRTSSMIIIVHMTTVEGCVFLE
ncbi:hypothetical protein Tco_0138462 [Tanacetum coccineum]